MGIDWICIARDWTGCRLGVNERCLQAKTRALRHTPATREMSGLRNVCLAEASRFMWRLVMLLAFVVA